MSDGTFATWKHLRKEFSCASEGKKEKEKENWKLVQNMLFFFFFKCGTPGKNNQGIHRFYNKMNKENFYHTHPVGRKQRCTTLLAYTLTVAVSGTLWDCSKIPSGMLHVIHWVFFCPFPTKHFHREKTMMSSSSPLCWERIIARFCWLEHFRQWHF